MTFNHSLIISLLLSLNINTARAADYLNEMDFFQEFPVVLSASRLRQPLSEAPNAMTVIDRKMIEASGFRDITDLFKLVPGMYVGYYKGHQGFVAYHGSPDQYSRRMQVMIDGRSIYLSPQSTIDWASLPITVNDIERIEVIRGPAAASHGANSTQGVISITTRDAGTLDGKRVSFTSGTKGINDVSARFGKRGEFFDYRMSLAYSADNGFDNLAAPPNSIPVPVATANGLINNSFDSNQARLMNYRADYHPGGGNSFDIQLGFNNDKKQVGWTDSPTNLVHNLITNAGFVQLGWTRALESNNEFKLRYFHIRNDQHETFPGVNSPPLVVQSVNTSRDDIEVQHTLSLPSSNRLVYGAAYRSDKVDGQYSTVSLTKPAYASSIAMDEWRLFAHDEWRINNTLLMNVGAMYERDRMGHKNLSPRVSLNYHVTAQHTFRAGASVAYRTPGLMESNGGVAQPGELWVINAVPTYPNLLPEKMVSREIGYLGEFRDWNASVDLRLFSDLLSRGIIGDGRAVNPFVNDFSAEYRGLEATLKYQLSETGELAANFAHELGSSNGPALAAAGSRATRPSCTWDKDVLSCSLPTNSASVLYSQHFSNEVSFSAGYYFQGSMQPIDRGSVDFQPIQRRTDVRIAKGFSDMSGVKGNISLVVQNLFNQEYTDYVANSLNNRRAYATLTLNW